MNLLLWRIRSFFSVKIALWKFQKYMDERVKEMHEVL